MIKVITSKNSTNKCVVSQSPYHKALKLQKVLAELDCNIKVRLGIHEAGDVCSEEGLIILQLCGTPEEMSNVANRINDLDGIQAKYIEMISDYESEKQSAS